MRVPCENDSGYMQVEAAGHLNLIAIQKTFWIYVKENVARIVVRNVLYE
jgi:hypothetical protein